MAMLTCEVCGQQCRRPAGLASHMRSKHPPEPTDVNTAALSRTLDALRAAGRLEPIDAARVQMLRSLAAAVDERPYSDRLWREYREALSEVLDADDAADDSLAEAVAAIRGAAKVGHP